MAIGSNSAIEFFGTQDTVTSTSSAVTDGSFSVAGDITTWTNDDDAPAAAVVFEGTYSVAPDVNSTVSLFARLMNIQSTNDQEIPDSNFQHTYLGSFPLNDVTTEQFVAIEVGLPNTKSSQEYDFYIQNNAGQTVSAGWDIHVTPKTIGPHA
jgi:hypothetical protein